MKKSHQEQKPAALKKQLDNKIWITRKRRINASERLLKSASFVDFINVYYSIFLIILSLLSISPFCNNDVLISYFGLAGSIALTISIIYATSLRYRERSAELKQNYIALQKLIDRLALAQDTDVEEIRAIQVEYTDLLSAVENHTDIDYLKLLNTGKVNDDKMTFNNKLQLFFYTLRHLLWKFCFIVAPIILFYIIFTQC